MGRTTRWLKSLFGLKKEKTNSGGENERMRPDSSLGRSGRETGGLCLNPNTIPPNITPAEAAWLKSFYCDSEKEQNKHAIAVAAATAAAADAAVAAAQAAVAVVRLTSQGRGGGGGGGTMFGSREKRAAIRIQTVFRGYLARKAHRALKGLVKLQALVRGYLVRKQATATLHSMQALIRAQASVRAHRTRGLIHHVHTNETSQPQPQPQSQFPARKSVERFDEGNKSVNSSRLSASFDSTNTSAIEESSTKIVEVDTGTGRPKSRSRRTNTDSGDESSCQTLPSPRFYRHPATLSVAADCRNSQEYEWWGLTGEECRGYYTAQSTPRFASGSSGGTTGATTNRGGGVTPGKGISMESLFRSMGTSPNYMASTQSFKAKLRSQSAPKQRPEPGGSKRRISSSMESRNSVSGVRMQRSCSHVQEVLNFKNAVMGRIGRSVELVRPPQH